MNSVYPRALYKSTTDDCKIASDAEHARVLGQSGYITYTELMSQDEVEPGPEIAPVDVDEITPVLADMTKKELDKYAEEKFGVNLDARKTKLSMIKSIEELLHGENG